MKTYEAFNLNNKLKWAKQWIEVWHIPYKYKLLYLRKIMDEQNAQKWSKYMEDDYPSDNHFKGERNFMLKDKNGVWLSVILDNNELITFKKLKTYKGEPKIEQYEIDAMKYNL